MLMFEGPVGRVVGLVDLAVAGTLPLVGLKDSPIGFDTERSIITRVTVGPQVNVQFSHTFGKHVYVYAFGDRIAGLTLSGLSFARDCGQPGDLQHGIEKMLQWFRTYKTSRTRKPIRVTIGLQENIDAFLVGLTGDVVDPQSMIVQWGATLMALPEDT